MPQIPMGTVLPGGEELTPARSAGSIMGALQEPTHSKDDPVLVVFMESAAAGSAQAVEVSAEAAVSMEAVVGATGRYTK